MAVASFLGGVDSLGTAPDGEINALEGCPVIYFVVRTDSPY